MYCCNFLSAAPPRTSLVEGRLIMRTDEQNSIVAIHILIDNKLNSKLRVLTLITQTNVNYATYFSWQHLRIA